MAGPPALLQFLASKQSSISLSFLPLTLGVGLSSGAEGGGLRPPSKTQAEKLLKRDDFTCRFCGFRSLQFQRVVPFEKDYVTACNFCEQVISLERAGIASSGVLIWLPEISQAELNHIVRAIYVARADEDSEISKAAERAFDALMARRVDAKKRLGSEDPLLLSTVLHENLTKKERVAAVKKLDGVRLLPLDKYVVRGHSGDFNAFPQMIKFWISKDGPFAKIPTGEWQKRFGKITT